MSYFGYFQLIKCLKLTRTNDLINKHLPRLTHPSHRHRVNLIENNGRETELGYLKTKEKLIKQLLNQINNVVIFHVEHYNS